MKNDFGFDEWFVRVVILNEDDKLEVKNWLKKKLWIHTRL